MSLVLTPAGPQPISSARQVADLNQAPAAPPAGASALTPLGDSVVYFASTELAGREPWRADPQPGSARQLRDIWPGSNDSGSPDARIALGGTIFFVTDDGTHGRELWATDGSTAGTRLVRDIRPDGDAFAFHADPQFAADGALVYFLADDGSGAALWQSDGTPIGTARVPPPGQLPPGAQPAVPPASVRYALRNTGAALELWRSGPPEQLVAAIDPTGASGGGEIVDAAEHSFFTVFGPGGTALWVTDGTAPGTLPLEPPPGGTASSDPRGFADAAGVTFFVAEDQAHGAELWHSDGTAAGTALVADIAPGPAGSSPRLLTPFGGALFFAIPGATGDELWRSDSTAAGTARVAQMTSVSALTARGGRLLVFDREGLWASDGTAAGTQLVTALHGTSGDLREVGGALTFVVSFYEDTLWRTDGTPQGTWAVRVIGGSRLQADQMTVLGDRLLFRTRSHSPSVLGYYAYTLMVSDGTSTGTLPLKVMDPGGTRDTSLTLDHLTAAGGRVLFSANDGAAGDELWRSDGTAAGTWMVADIAPGAAGSGPDGLVADGALLYFLADDGAHGRELWRSDGTAAGTWMVADLAPGTASPQIGDMALAGGALYFTALDGAHGRELWRSDGTAAGTWMVADLAPGTASSLPGQIGDGLRPGEVLFSASDGDGVWLWSSDGTAAGTHRVDGPAGGRPPQAPRAVTRTGQQALLSANDGVTGWELWSLSLTYRAALPLVAR